MKKKFPKGDFDLSAKHPFDKTESLIFVRFDEFTNVTKGSRKLEYHRVRLSFQKFFKNTSTVLSVVCFQPNFA